MLVKDFCTQNQIKWIYLDLVNLGKRPIRFGLNDYNNFKQYDLENIKKFQNNVDSEFIAIDTFNIYIWDIDDKEIAKEREKKFMRN